MSHTSHYRNIELFIEPAIWKVKYLVYVPKYGFEKEPLKNLACMLAKKKFYLKLLKYQLPYISFILLKNFMALKNNNLKIKDLHLENSTQYCTTALQLLLRNQILKDFGLVCCLNGKRLTKLRK